MKYVRCPRCGLNWMLVTEQYCKVCRDELDGIRSVFDQEDEKQICPFCNKNLLIGDEPMCAECRRQDENQVL